MTRAAISRRIVAVMQGANDCDRGCHRGPLRWRIERIRAASRLGDVPYQVGISFDVAATDHGILIVEFEEAASVRVDVERGADRRVVIRASQARRRPDVIRAPRTLLPTPRTPAHHAWPVKHPGKRQRRRQLS